MCIFWREEGKKILLGGEQYMQYLKVDDFRIILVIF